MTINRSVRANFEEQEQLLPYAFFQNNETTIIFFVDYSYLANVKLKLVVFHFVHVTRSVSMRHECPYRNCEVKMLDLFKIV